MRHMRHLPNVGLASACPSLRGSARHKLLAQGRAPPHFPSMNKAVTAIAALTFAFHMATAKLYGFFIDEIYFLACGEHLAWGYVDFPPLTAFQAWLTRYLFGDSAYSIRLFPSLAAAGIVLLAAAMARELGGGRVAQIMAALVAFLSPGYLASCSYLDRKSVV